MRLQAGRILGKALAMTGNNRPSLRGALGAIVLLASAAMLGAPPARAQMHGGSMMAWQMPSGLADEVEIRIVELHNALRVTPEQEPVFRVYADVMRANAQTMQGLFQQRAQATDFTAPARLRWYAQLTATHATAVNNLIAPFDALYQTLSDSQKQAADQYFEALQQRRMPRHMQ
jgi:protein CpxP